MPEDSNNLDKTTFNMGISILQRIDGWQRRAEEFYSMRMPEQMKLCLDNVHMIIALFLPEMSGDFQKEFREKDKQINRHLKSLANLKNKFQDHKRTADRTSHEHMTSLLLKELFQFNVCLNKILHAKGLSLTDKPNPGKAMLKMTGR
ncbi:hypothetical protein LCGC14_0534660 [marine sediment metagenome]|uniref:Uncharacterized protein n=1 Tax=marine sediment metagenome TaxID=412755 RepID=A0A0F9RUN2_9ZZZZ